jgi:hypothetical protein
LPGTYNDEICGLVHPHEIDLLRRTRVILIKTYIGADDLSRHSNLLQEIDYDILPVIESRLKS